jgi:hypothetical protein
MPSLKGYEVQTHQILDSWEIDVLHAPDDAQNIYVPGQQLAALTGDGHRSTGHYSTSDMGRLIAKQYQVRVPDPHKIYSRSRVRSTTLFAVEGLIQRTFHTKRISYIGFCGEFIEHILPRYSAFAASHAELIMAWYEAIDHFNAVRHNLGESTFQAALAARDLRMRTYPTATPVLVIGTVACKRALYYAGDGTACLSASRFNAATLATPVATFEVAQLSDAHIAMLAYRERQRGAPPLAVHLALSYSDGTINLPDGTRIVRPAAVVTPTPPPAAQAGTTAEDVKQALRAIMMNELPGVVETIVLKVVRSNIDRGQQAELISAMTGNVMQLAEIVTINREQLELSRQSIDLITPSHQLFLSAKDYVEMDGVAEALKRAPNLTTPSLGLDHCTDYGKASLWMKRLCREENRKVAANAVARIIAKDAGLEEPPLYIPEFRMKRVEREHVKVLMFNPACWARCKQTFLPIDTPTLLFPGPKTKAATDDKTKAEEA